MNKNTYTVHYSFYLSESVDIEAESESQAEEIVKQKIIAGELGNLNEMDIGDQEVWVD